MDWLLFSYSLPTGQKSSARVTLWRRLQRLGAVAPVTGTYILPAHPQCLESFQWLAKELRQHDGEALVVRAAQIEGMSDEQIVALFCEARRQDYAAIRAEAQHLKDIIESEFNPDQIASLQNALAKLRRQHAEIARVDYFNCPEGIALDRFLNVLSHSLVQDALQSSDLPRQPVEAYRGKRWVTRPQPHVDRLACIWLIKTFIDRDAVIHFTNVVQGEDVPFDMEKGVFTHHGNRCTFETMIHVFGLEANTSLTTLAEIVHEIDLQDGRYTRPEVNGIAAVLQGWLLAALTDAELVEAGQALFTGLYATLAYRSESET